MTVQTFQLPVMAQLLQADFLRQHELLHWWGERRAFLGYTSEICHRGWAVDPSIDHTLNVLHSSVVEDVM